MTSVTNNISRRRNTKKEIFTENEDIEKRTEDILTENTFRVLYLYSGSLEKIISFTVKVNTNPSTYLKLLNVRIAYWKINILYFVKI